MSKTAFINGVLALLLLLVSPSTAEIKTIAITSDTRPLILFQKFGFTYPGSVAIVASSVSVVVPSSQPKFSQRRLGFFLISKESLQQVMKEIAQNPTLCILDSRYSLHLFTFLDLSPPPATFNRSFPVTVSNEYGLFFANCVPESSVTMTVHTELFNHNDDGSRNYLSSGQTHLPSLFFIFSFAYFSFFLAFSLYHRHVTSHRIHLLLPMLLLASALSLLFAAMDMHYVEVNGTHAWDVYFFNFDLARVVLFFGVVVLVGTRWTFLQPVVRESGRKTLLVVIPLQVLARCAYALVHDTGPYIKDWVTWNRVLLLLDFFSCCGVVWSIRSSLMMKKMTSHTEEGYNKLSIMKRFYLVVIGYLFFTRFGMFAFKEVLVPHAYGYEWVSNLLEETATLVFCIVMFYVFGLLEKDELYSVIGEEKEALVPEIIAVKE